MPDQPFGGGERDGDRAAMERVADRMVRSGMRGEDAIRDARSSMERADRGLRDRGRR